MKITCKKCRRLGQSVCGREKCAFHKKPQKPGVPSKRRSRLSEYGRQLAEKQKLKIIYGLREKQFRNYFTKAEKKKDQTGDALMTFLETRLDNVVFRLGLTSTRRQARQLVSHGHFTVNGRKVNIPSFSVKPGDVIAIRSFSREKKSFGDLAVSMKKYDPPVWLKLDRVKFEGEVLASPSKELVGDVPVEIAQIVEFYSR